jgi:hypothetical protein
MSPKLYYFLNKVHEPADTCVVSTKRAQRAHTVALPESDIGLVSPLMPVPEGYKGILTVCQLDKCLQ